MAKILMKGNEAIGEAAITAGCTHFFGYPITPQSELPAYLARKLPEAGGVFLQSESEVSAINMVYGAAAAGVRVMTSSSSPGISLKQEGISYIAGAELPCVICNIQRGGPGLGTIQPSQADYFQATKGGGHGDYRLIVLAPSSVQEIVDLIRLAFELADKYRNPAMMLGDGTLGQMMEPVDISDYTPQPPPKPWATTGCKGREPNLITSIHLAPEELEEHNIHLQRKYAEIREKEQRAERWKLEDAEIVVVAFGTVARIAKSAIRKAREAGIKAGLLRPITLWPFPEKEFQNLPAAKAILVSELSAGQMIEDVKLSIEHRLPVEFHGRMGGMVPNIEDLLDILKEMAAKYGEVSK
ncbi:MAG: 3-methyl-2-oxobutanoate dehydrogenase subunit VorB [Chloroflexi bacterium]|nr:3-methyl-2-oxobutanoate dehydrogenase subunit VorB [Chloroflexota bacterium]